MIIPSTHRDVVYEYEQKLKDGRLLEGDDLPAAMAREIQSLRREVGTVHERIKQYQLELLKERRLLRAANAQAIAWCPKCTPKEKTDAG